jgi:hypothetical protein
MASDFSAFDAGIKINSREYGLLPWEYGNHIVACPLGSLEVRWRPEKACSGGNARMQFGLA